ncbi:hypothetical protein AOQ84DRAFT_26691 [Glonium stellatum]|uniref:Uncharacterized protein n=1 Tax=Glonium stellatum TaxID=574774 RepID=A0A8E2F2R6_9PEZI|nr:hypothetical protein AOQ84DRAFT_26691 [Glonium stellatum]
MRIPALALILALATPILALPVIDFFPKDKYYIVCPKDHNVRFCGVPTGAYNCASSSLSPVHVFPYSASPYTRTYHIPSLPSLIPSPHSPFHASLIQPSTPATKNHQRRFPRGR